MDIRVLLICFLNLNAAAAVSDIWEYKLDIQFIRMLPTNSYGDSCKTERILYCAYRCISDSKCASLIYDSKSRQCWLLTETVGQHQTEISSHLLYVDIGRQKEAKGTDIFVIDAKSWKDGERLCGEQDARLYQIDSQEKQDKAVTLARSSGIDDLAIGVLMDNFAWVYIDISPLHYSAWVPSQPLGFYAAISRTFDYKWIATSAVTGAICELD